MKNFQRLALCAIVAGSIVSCQKDEVSEEAAQPEVQQGVSTDILEKVRDLYMNPTDVVAHKFTDFEGNEQSGFLISGDQFMTEAQINEALELNSQSAEDGLGAKQYATRNRVRANTVIRVMGYTGGRVSGGPENVALGLSGNMRTGLQRAINNYNAENINLRFDLFFSSNAGDSGDADMIVYSIPSRGAGGIAGFPSNGRPFRFVRINEPTGRSNADINEHVITHEIGHSIGFRHTDYFSRQSCGQNTNEGSGGVGAIRIPGTPSGFDPTSIMLSCFNNGVNGEFNNNDKTALRALYPR